MIITIKGSREVGIKKSRHCPNQCPNHIVWLCHPPNLRAVNWKIAILDIASV